MVNYLGKFVYNLSKKTEKLRILLDKTVQWQWGPEQEQEWQYLKTLSSTQPLLKFYNQSNNVKTSSDASNYGIDAVILQQHDGEWQPVAYVPRAMTSAETRYAQIEKELLSIMFACERFHQFIYGQTVISETDHKPLVHLFHKSLNDCPLGIQRLMTRLQKYSLKVSYTPRKCMHTADALSRARDPNEAQSSTEEDVQVYVNMVTSNMPVSSERMDQLRCETEKSM